MGQTAAIATDTSLDAEEFRILHLSELLRLARSKARVPTELAPWCSHEVGLTQEQTAHLLAIGDRQYREFERGRVVHPDPRFIEQVVRVLGMSTAERDALYRLAARRPPPPVYADTADVSELRPMLDSLEVPALVTDIAWNILAWNASACENLLNPAEVPIEERNAVLLGFGPGSDLFPGDVPEIGRIVGWVRSAYLAEGGQNRAIQGLVDRLLTIPTAAEHWRSGALALEPIYETRTLDRPGRSPVLVRAVRSRLPQGLRLTQFIPISATCERKSAGGPGDPPADQDVPLCGA